MSLYWSVSPTPDSMNRSRQTSQSRHTTGTTIPSPVPSKPAKPYSQPVPSEKPLPPIPPPEIPKSTRPVSCTEKVPEHRLHLKSEVYELLWADGTKRPGIAKTVIQAYYGPGVRSTPLDKANLRFHPDPVAVKDIFEKLYKQGIVLRKRILGSIKIGGLFLGTRPCIKIYALTVILWLTPCS